MKISLHRFLPSAWIAPVIGVMFGLIAYISCVIMGAIVGGIIDGWQDAVKLGDGAPAAFVGAGLTACLGFLLLQWFEAVPEDLEAAANPQAVFARDRRTALLLFGCGLVFGLLAGIGTGLGFGLLAGIGAGLVGALIGGLYMSGSWAAWPVYVLSKTWLAIQHRLPWSLMDFLADAHKRGVLRQTGAVYQFRHIELQHRLANRAADKQ